MNPGTPPLFSVCITTFNDSDTLIQSLSSLFSQIDLKSTEVVVVDSKSRDGSTEILRTYANLGALKLIVKRCSVGAGRNLAFLNSAGDYIVSGVDTDDVLKPGFGEILSLYLANYKGAVLRGYDFFIIPRTVTAAIGGWRDTHAAEDIDFISRAERFGAAVIYNRGLRIKKQMRPRYYRGPFRILENMRRFPIDKRAGVSVLRTKPGLRKTFWRFVWLFACTPLVDNRATEKILTFLIANFGVSI